MVRAQLGNEVFYLSCFVLIPLLLHQSYPIGYPPIDTNTVFLSNTRLLLPSPKVRQRKQHSKPTPQKTPAKHGSAKHSHTALEQAGSKPKVSTLTTSSKPTAAEKAKKSHAAPKKAASNPQVPTLKPVAKKMKKSTDSPKKSKTSSKQPAKGK